MGEVKPRTKQGPKKRRAKVEVGGIRPPARPHGSTRDGRYFDGVRRALIEHVGGKPNAAQLVLIDRCAWLALYVSRLNAKISAGSDLAAHAGREYLAWSNSLARALNTLGLKPSEAPVRSIEDILASHASRPAT